MAKSIRSRERTRIAGNGNTGLAIAEPANANDLHDEEEVARLAYSYWLARGCAEGSSEEDWLRAEQEVLQQHRSAVK